VKELEFRIAAVYGMGAHKEAFFELDFSGFGGDVFG
jgi:hypothetical protein